MGSEFRIEAVSKRHRWLKMLIYGDYGVGKTFLAGTSAGVPDMENVIMLNAESGDLTLDSDDHNFDAIDAVTIKDFKQAAKAYDFLKLHCQFRDEDNTEKLIALQEKVTGTKPKKDEVKIYRTCIVDSLTEVEQYCMNQLLGISETTSLDEETQSAEWAEYKRNHSMMLRLVRNFRDLPMHTIFTCSRTYVQDEAKRMLFSPSMTGKLAGQIQGFMDVVGYLATGSAQEDGTIPRRLYVQPAGKFAAKCRFSRFKAPFFDNPTMAEILASVGLDK